MCVGPSPQCRYSEGFQQLTSPSRNRFPHPVMQQVGDWQRVYKFSNMQVIGNAGYKLSWAADPTPAPYWMNRALEHGFLRCTVNGTAFGCEVMLYLILIEIWCGSALLQVLHIFVYGLFQWAFPSSLSICSASQQQRMP